MPRAAALLGMAVADTSAADNSKAEESDRSAPASTVVNKHADEMKKMLGFEDDGGGSGDDSDEDDGPALPTFDPRNMKTVPLTKFQNLEAVLTEEREHRRRALEALQGTQEQLGALQATSRQQLAMFRKELENVGKHGNGLKNYAPDVAASLPASHTTYTAPPGEYNAQTEEAMRKLRSENDALRQKVRELEAAVKDVTRSASSTSHTAPPMETARATPKGEPRDDGETRRLAEEVASLKGELKAAVARAAAAEAAAAQANRELGTLRESTAALQRSASKQANLAAALAKLRAQAKTLRRDHDVLARDVASIPTEAGVAAEALRLGMMRLSKMASAGLDDVVAKYKKEAKERKKLFNQLQELKGNIRVFCRVRPLTSMELERTHNNSSTCSFVDEDEIVLTSDRSQKSFEFDRVFQPHETQEEVFKDTLPLVTSVVDGYNVCIFAYGQTGSGKTYTMEGPPDDPGVNTRALSALFDLCSSRSSEYEFEILASVLEIYNESIRDLLDKSNSNAKLEVRQTPTGFWVPELIQKPVTSIKDVEKLMAIGKANRTTFTTNMNEHSSRSHSMLSIHVKSSNRVSGVSAIGRLHLVDLAGSERVSRSEATGDRLKEAQAINKSLSALGDVIAALASKAAHVPYRNSKLTHLLQDSLSGDSKTLMFVQVSPASDNVQESLCSLNFAVRVRNVELGQAKKHTEGAAEELAKYKKMVAALQARLEGAEGSARGTGSGSASPAPGTPSRAGMLRSGSMGK
eukprot:jgi/Mesvir1/23202/Mv22665-RA.1